MSSVVGHDALIFCYPLLKFSVCFIMLFALKIEDRLLNVAHEERLSIIFVHHHDPELTLEFDHFYLIFSQKIRRVFFHWVHFLW